MRQAPLFLRALPSDHRLLHGALAAEEIVQGDIDRSGILLADERVLCAMEPALAGKFIPVKAKKDGFSGKSAVTAEEMDELERTMRQTVARIGSEMCGGGAEARPRTLHGQSPCEWCAMKPLCRVQGVKNEKNTADGAAGEEES